MKILIGKYQGTIYPETNELVSSLFAQRSGCLTGRVDLFAAG